MKAKILKEIRKRYHITYLKEEGEYKSMWQVIDTKKKEVRHYFTITGFIYDYITKNAGFGSGFSYQKRLQQRRKKVKYYEALSKVRDSYSQQEVIAELLAPEIAELKSKQQNS